VTPQPYSVDPDMKSTRVGFNQMIKLVGDGNLRVLNLGDGNHSLLTKGLRALGHEVITLDCHFDARVKWDLEKGLPSFGGKKFNVVVAGEVFEHIYNLKVLLASVRKVLLPDGFLVLSVPNVCNLRSRVRVLLGKLPSYAADGDLYHDQTGYSGHIRDFNQEMAYRYLKEAGFKVVSCAGNGLYYHWKPLLPSWFIPPSLADNIIIKAVKNDG
jgi:SAM-dependent methyltransferase